jgi:hypothetical protein
MTAIIQDIASVFFVLALGYFSGKQGMFTQDQAEGLNRLVLKTTTPRRWRATTPKRRSPSCRSNGSRPCPISASPRAAMTIISSMMRYRNAVSRGSYP